ncbi:unnamed protein product [Psylliodes chrysocephalus]|uniref:Protein lifeguard 1 n=1 Tax=Psylliodes chrysocephalus TaxID=3402493 RepID=A0A9P0G715_9CUCU|nr:unnamed protein product [Psylliodes chrysocephala]
MTQTDIFEKSTEKLYVNPPATRIIPAGPVTVDPFGYESSQSNPSSMIAHQNNTPPQPSPPEDHYTSAVYGQELKEETFYFNDASVRKAFVKKVFAIVSVQLAVTMAITCWFIFEHNTKKFVQKHIEFAIVAVSVEIVVLVALICFGELRRRTPTNYILLCIFTLSKAFLIGVLASFYDVLAVVLALGFTIVVCVGLTLLAYQTKFDFTAFRGILFIILLIFVCFGISCIFLLSQLGQLIYASLGAVVFSFFFVFDLQLMMGGGHKYQISPEEYVFAAINLYMDVIYIFIYILRIVGGR